LNKGTETEIQTEKRKETATRRQRDRDRQTDRHGDRKTKMEKATGTHVNDKQNH